MHICHHRWLIHLSELVETTGAVSAGTARIRQSSGSESSEVYSLYFSDALNVCERGCSVITKANPHTHAHTHIVHIASLRQLDHKIEIKLFSFFCVCGHHY